MLHFLLLIIPHEKMLLRVLSLAVDVHAAESAPISHIARLLVCSSFIVHGISLAGLVEVLAGHSSATHGGIIDGLQVLVLGQIDTSRLEGVLTCMMLLLTVELSRRVLQLVAVSTELHFRGL